MESKYSTTSEWLHVLPVFPTLYYIPMQELVEHSENIVYRYYMSWKWNLLQLIFLIEKLSVYEAEYYNFFNF
jgi:hypothetical protein